jgi:hypothetical protein
MAELERGGLNTEILFLSWLATAAWKADLGVAVTGTGLVMVETVEAVTVLGKAIRMPAVAVPVPAAAVPVPAAAVPVPAAAVPVPAVAVPLADAAGRAGKLAKTPLLPAKPTVSWALLLTVSTVRCVDLTSSSGVVVPDLEGFLDLVSEGPEFTCRMETKSELYLPY